MTSHASPMVILDPLTRQPVQTLSSYLYRISPNDVELGWWSEGGYDPYKVGENVIDSRGYIYQGVPFPTQDVIQGLTGSNNLAVPAQKQIEGQITVAPGSLLIGIRCTSLQQAGFDFRIYEKDMKWDLFYGEYASNYMIGNYATLTDPTLSPCDTRLDGVLLGMFMLPSPLVLAGKSILNIQLTNRASVSNQCQVYLMFAMPSSYSGVASAA